MKKFFIGMLLLVFSLSLTACDKKGSDNNITGITLTGDSIVTVGSTITITAAVTPSTETNYTVTWESSNTTAATVANGVVTGLAPGITTITATVTGTSISNSMTVVVKKNSSGGGDPTDLDYSYFKETKLTEDKKIYVLNDISIETLDYDGLFTAQAIQGLFSRDKINMYIDGRSYTSQVNTDNYYLNYAAEKYGLILEKITLQKAVELYIESFEENVRSGLWGSQIPLEAYNNMVGITAYTETSGEGYTTPGYIVYREGTVSVNVAATLAGITGFLPVELSEVETFKAMGLVEKFNVDSIALGYRWLFNIAMSELNPDGLVHQNYLQNSDTNPYLKDYGIANKYMYVYYDTTTNAPLSFRKALHGFLTKNMPIFGYTYSEDADVEFFSQYGQFIIPTDYSYNLTFFSATEFHEDENGERIVYSQPNDDTATVADPNKHYVSFVVSDGDNATYWQNTATFSTTYMATSDRENDDFAVTWSMTPSLSDLMPIVLQSIYNEKATDKDYFSVPVCGQGYINAGAYSSNNPEAFADYLEKLNIYMGKSGLNSVTVMGAKNNSELTAAISGFASVDNVNGGIVYSGGKYFTNVKGGVYWSNGKPFVGPRDSLWETTPEYIAARINQYETDPTSVNGYSVINVHPWSHTYEDIRTIVSLLNDNVEVVSLDAILTMMTDNITNKTNSNDWFNIPEKNGVSITEGYLQEHPELIPVNPLFNDFLLWQEDWSGATYTSSDAAVSNVDAYYKGSIKISAGNTATKETFNMPNQDNLWLNFSARADSTDPTKTGKFKVSITIGNKTVEVIKEATLRGVKGTQTQTVSGDGWQIFAIPFDQYFENYKNLPTTIKITAIAGGEAIKIDQFRISQRLLENASEYDPYNNEFNDKNTEDIMLGHIYKTSQYYFFGAYDKDTLEARGAIQIDCSDGGGDEKRNGNTNLWMAKYYTLPNSDSINLSMKFTNNANDGAKVKVTLYIDGYCLVLQDWARVMPEVSFDIHLQESYEGIDFSNKKATIVIEGRDSGGNNGVGESWFLQYIKTITN